MFKNYLIVSFRNFRHNKVITAINFFGLMLGILCSLVIFFHIKDEFSYDKGIENAENIYRVINQRSGDQGLRFDSGGPVPLADAIRNDYPEVSNVVRFWRANRPTVRYQDKIFQEKNLLFTDANVFAFFSLDLLMGNPETALELPNSVVINVATAKRYFDDQDPIGKTLSYNGYPNGKMDLVITGVMQDLPHNTHLNFDFLASFTRLEQEIDNWGSFKPVWTYVTLNEGRDQEDFEEKLVSLAKRYVPDRTEEDASFAFKLEPMLDIHLYSKAGRSMKTGGDIRSVYLFGIIGVGILLIACINFINLTTAQSFNRFKEVGIRKSMGAGSDQIIKQFLIETILTIVIASVLALTLMIYVLPVYNTLAGKNVQVMAVLDFNFLGISILFLFILSVISGIYPSLLMSRLGPLKALKKTNTESRSKASFRKALVIVQFFISTTMIIGTLIVRQQMQYINNKPLGVNVSNVVAIPYSLHEEVIMDELETHPGISSVSLSQRLPVNTLSYDGRVIKVEGKNDKVPVQSCVISPEFLETYELELVAGSNYQNLELKEYQFIINESAVQAFGWGNAQNSIGRKVFWSEKYNVIGEVIGVVKDFHLESLHKQIPPMVMFRNWEDNWGKDFISVKLNDRNVNNTLHFIEQTWKKHNPEEAYSYVFLDESYASLHSGDATFQNIFNLFSFIAIVIACLGLFGLSLFTMLRKVKEIGIRKVLGATTSQLTLRLSGEFLGLVIIGSAFAVPVTYYFMQEWLNDFSYKISINVGLFIIAILFMILLALLTIGVQTVKASNANPVDSLREE